MKRTHGNVITFLRRNASYVVLAFCILAVGLSVALVILNEKPDVGINQEQPVDKNEGNNSDGTVNNPGTNEEVPVIKEIKFIMPVNTNNISEYSETMVFNSTLNRYSVHKAMDFMADEGSPVYAVYDGTVEKIESSLLTGVTVTIDHGNGLKTVYNSMADAELLVEGQKVSQGEVIGEVSVTNRQEYKNGAHLHFEVMENGEIIDPVKYLTLEEK